MSIVDVPQPKQTEAEKMAIRIRELLSSVIGHTESALHQIRNIVRGNRTEIAAELGDDAAAMLTVYNKLKEAVEVAKEIEVEDLP